MKLYTGGGDAGETSLFDGSRVPKDHPRIAACGDVDQLVAFLGWCRTAPGSEALTARFEEVQRDLFALGAELATPETRKDAPCPLLQRDHCEKLEGWIDEASGATPPLRVFVLPGGTELAGRLHLARTSCRRAERSVVTLARQADLRPEAIVYLNRLADLLFAWARLANHDAGCPEVTWTARK